MLIACAGRCTAFHCMCIFFARIGRCTVNHRMCILFASTDRCNTSGRTATADGPRGRYFPIRRAIFCASTFSAILDRVTLAFLSASTFFPSTGRCSTFCQIAAADGPRGRYFPIRRAIFFYACINCCTAFGSNAIDRLTIAFVGVSSDPCTAFRSMCTFFTGTTRCTAILSRRILSAGADLLESALIVAYRCTAMLALFCWH